MRTAHRVEQRAETTRKTLSPIPKAVDDSIMRGKLSQPDTSILELPPAATEGRPSSSRPSMQSRREIDFGSTFSIGRASSHLMIAVLLLACVGACSNESTRSDETGSDAAGPAQTPKPAEIADTFRWPTAPHDPVLRLEVELDDRKTEVIEIDLTTALAPACVARIAELTERSYYDGTTFHRVIPGFMIQGGDPKSRDQNPSNDGSGGAESGLPDETSAAPFERGVVALANRGRASSNSSQFFIMIDDHPELNGLYTIVGRVRSGLEVVDAIAETTTDRVGRWGPKDRPLQNVVIRRATIAAEEKQPEAPR